jgi:hypothetical protein
VVPRQPGINRFPKARLRSVVAVQVGRRVKFSALCQPAAMANSPTARDQMVAATRPLNIALVLLEMVLLTILASVMMTFTSDNPPETSPSCLMTDQLNCTRHWQDSIPPSTLQERQANVFLSPPNCYSTALAASVADTWRALVENLQVCPLCHCGCQRTSQDDIVSDLPLTSDLTPRRGTSCVPRSTAFCCCWPSFLS